jgi:hypothetical protein
MVGSTDYMYGQTAKGEKSSKPVEAEFNNTEEGTRM